MPASQRRVNAWGRVVVRVLDKVKIKIDRVESAILAFRVWHSCLTLHVKDFWRLHDASCPLCGERFLYVPSLRQHLLQFHFQCYQGMCSFCLKPLQSPRFETLQRHIESSKKCTAARLKLLHSSAEPGATAKEYVWKCRRMPRRACGSSGSEFLLWDVQRNWYAALWAYPNVDDVLNTLTYLENKLERLRTQAGGQNAASVGKNATVQRGRLLRQMICLSNRLLVEERQKK